MGYLLSVYTDELELLHRLLGTRDEATLKTMLSDENITNEEPEIKAALRDLIDKGFDGDYPSPADTILALNLLYHKHSTWIGELDHFRYEEEDLPELWEFQTGETSSTLDLPVDLENGIPSVKHWPLTDVKRLHKSMLTVNLRDRKEYTHDEFQELRTWLTKAIDASKGLMAFYK